MIILILWNYIELKLKQEGSELTTKCSQLHENIVQLKIKSKKRVNLEKQLGFGMERIMSVYDRTRKAEQERR